MRHFIPVFSILLLAACATSSPARYAKDGATRDEFDEAAYQCLKKTLVSESGAIKNAYGKIGEVSGSVNCDRFNRCMASSGFNKSPNGTFTVRDFGEVNCKQ